MSRTYRLINYKYGRPIYSRNINQEVPYHWMRHEHPIERRNIYRAHRRRCKVYIEKFHEYLPFIKTCGWNTW